MEHTQQVSFLLLQCLCLVVAISRLIQSLGDIRNIRTYQQEHMQIKNHLATKEFSSFRKPGILEQDKSIKEHRDALQKLSNGRPLAYAATLRCVKCEGSRAPPQAPPVTRKPPGYIRNQLGGYFTS